MPLPRHCLKCGIKYMPFTRDCKLCNKCYKESKHQKKIKKWKKEEELMNLVE